MKRVLLIEIVLLLSLLCAVFGCRKEEQNGVGSIYGTVTDVATGNPVANANVQLLQNGNATLYASITGYDGGFEILDVPSGTYSLKVTKERYSDLLDDYDIVVKNGKQTKRDVQIRKLPSSLHIYDNENQEISELDFGSNEGVVQKTFSIFNGGDKSINYVITKTAGWISDISQPTGTISVGVTYPIIITINRDSLAYGYNTTVLLVTSSADGATELIVKARRGGGDSDLVIELPSVGLMVQKNDLGVVDWGSAELLCSSSTVGDYNDWRLPTKEELMTLYSNRDYIGGFVEERYWSSSVHGGYRYYVDFENGALDYWGQGNDCYVRAVRTFDQSAPLKFLDDSGNEMTELDFGVDVNVTQKTIKIRNVGNQVISYSLIKQANWIANINPFSGELNPGSTIPIVVSINRNLLSDGDNSTTILLNALNFGEKELVVKAQKAIANSVFELTSANLMVQTQDLGCVDQHSAQSMCESSTVGNYTDWRLPTKEELMVLYNNRESIGGFNSDKYWSSTTDGYSNGSYTLYYAVDFSNGMLDDFPWINQYFVRAVRPLHGGSAPSAPTGVTAIISGYQIKVSWNNVPNADEYEVYWSNYGGTYNTIGTTSDTFIFDNAPYEDNYYKVKAKNSYGESPFSSSVYCSYSSGGGGGQTYSYSFELDWQGWQTIDADGDGNAWKRGTGTNDIFGHNGSTYAMCSQSYINDFGALTPDNYLVSPQKYNVSNGATISFYVSAYDANYPAEHYGVAVSTASGPSANSFVVIWEETLSAKVKSGGKTRGNSAQGNWYLKTIDLSDYAGQSIWIAIRHFNCTDQFVIRVDDITIKTGN